MDFELSPEQRMLKDSVARFQMIPIMWGRFEICLVLEIPGTALEGRTLFEDFFRTFFEAIVLGFYFWHFFGALFCAIFFFWPIFLINSFVNGKNSSVKVSLSASAICLFFSIHADRSTL